MGSLDRATQWLAYRAASGYDPSSRSLRYRKEKEQEKGITKKGGRTTKKQGRTTKTGSPKKKGGRTTKKNKDVPPKRDRQKEIGITAKAYSHLLKMQDRWQYRWKDYGFCCVDKRFTPVAIA